MKIIRKSQDRGRGDHGWLNSKHTFSFAGYHDPAHMGFGALRVINEDWVAGGGGFPPHPHQDMEIISYVLEGQLKHQDSMGFGSVVSPGEVQLMSAGTGVVHSEYNGSSRDPLHFLQIWILPEERGIEPTYQEKAFTEEERSNALRLLVSPSGREGSLRIRQDMELYGALLDADRVVEYRTNSHRKLWLQVARGALEVDGQRVEAGDGVAMTEQPSLQVKGLDKAELLLFDLA